MSASAQDNKPQPDPDPSSRTPFTPGPWLIKRAEIRIDDEYDYAIYDTGHQVIAEAFGRSGVSDFPPAEANARLISAAPDLYEAVKGFLDLYVALVNSGDCGNWNPEEEDVVIAARAALQKADGR